MIRTMNWSSLCLCPVHSQVRPDLWACLFYLDPGECWYLNCCLKLVDCLVSLAGDMYGHLLLGQRARGAPWLLKGCR